MEEEFAKLRQKLQEKEGRTLEEQHRHEEAEERAKVLLPQTSSISRLVTRLVLLSG
jgi:hypothetical protein